MKCIIKEKRTKVLRVTDHELRVARLEGRPPPKARRPVCYVELETDKEYLCLSGGFAWPRGKPGFAVVLGVRKATDGKGVIYETLEEIEEKNVQSLLERSFNLYLKWGKSCLEIPWVWYGDPKKGLNKFLYEFNALAKAKSSLNQKLFYLTHPPYYTETDPFEIYCQTIYALLRKGKKRLFLGPCKILQSYLEHFSEEDVYKGTSEDHPAIAAVGYVLTALHTYKPWMREVSVSGRESSDFEEYALAEHSQTLKDLGVLDDHRRADFGVDTEGQVEETGDGLLRHTIPKDREK